MAFVINAARWALALPGAVLSAWVGYYLMEVANRFSMLWVGVNLDGFFARVYLEAVGAGTMGAVFVYIGTRIVPDYKKEAALIFGGIGLLIVGAATFAALLSSDYWAIWNDVCMGVVAGLMVYGILTDEVDVGPSVSGWRARPPPAPAPPTGKT